ncbi:hypothetical protein NLJ89_g10859 [Agrocybe chaxingu]|uniref:G protein alpha subunit n=1 Tax=Agrocybe chaxingu TaxID=84603 RepID=A0A9W8JR06_9AGAR|nr:hypothetical protein NLJ89_g10859 [Agrocybe chaxingu]
MHRHNDNYDPLALAIAPPANETPAQRAAREKSEYEALLRSRKIDLELKAAKAAMKRYNKAVKILVLGQSLSGKSTTIKNFQMTYAHKSWSEERASWKAVILLNLVRSVNIMLDVINDTDNASTPHDHDPVVDFSQSPTSLRSGTRPTPTEKHRSVALRLTPLRQIEKDLRAFLGARSSEISDSQKGGLNGTAQLDLNFQEFSIRSSSGWKGILDHIRNPQPGKDAQLHRVACHVVAGCRDDIRWLWDDPTTQAILCDRLIRLEDSPGFFLNDIDRIASLDYEPTDQDIVRARLRTTGVQEYRFTLDKANGVAAGLEWIMYDVAGIRTSRAAWIPYFKDITALIFLAPISSFNERLEEDDRINRLEDTLVLWKKICSNPLLSEVQIILFMNKIDLLKKKLERGVRVQKYIPDFDKSNDFETVSLWFRRVFRRIYVDNMHPNNPFISHFTSVVDTKTTAQTLEAVQATILRHDIVDAGLL